MWLKSYLRRKQFVSVNGSCSVTRGMKYGVPQGSILGPLLFIVQYIYITDISESLRQHISQNSFYIRLMMLT